MFPARGKPPRLRARHAQQPEVERPGRTAAGHSAFVASWIAAEKSRVFIRRRQPADCGPPCGLPSGDGLLSVR